MYNNLIGINMAAIMRSGAHMKDTESFVDTKVYSEVPGLAAWSKNCKWYSSLPLGAVVSLFCESVL
jgi:hypothetical protein